MNEDEEKLIKTQTEMLAMMETDVILGELARRFSKIVVVWYNKLDSARIHQQTMVKVGSIFELEGILAQSLRQVQYEIMRLTPRPTFMDLKYGIGDKNNTDDI